MLARSLWILAAGCVFFLNTASADILGSSICTIVGGANSCSLYESNDGITLTERPNAVNLAVPLNFLDLLITKYVVLSDPGKIFSQSDASTWSDVLLFDTNTVQLFSDPFTDAAGLALVSAVQGAGSKVVNFEESTSGITLAHVGGDFGDFTVYSGAVPEPTSILLFGVAVAFAGKGLLRASRR
jgi:photosystem II stability/assembly factor-like uncharacterized protein